ncbi:MAG TPA: PEP-CTERM sorting domain-containing protein [Pirellulales bacterium]|nr:PEP-CTERM sorting domain-containing protein [Pirellulales bacterium]
MRFRGTELSVLACLAVVVIPNLCMAAATTGMKTPYYQKSDSALVYTSAGYHLDDFEDGFSINDTGVTVTSLNGWFDVGGYSVDADDGVIDGSGNNGHSLEVVTAGGQSEATFTFNSGVLGGLPLSAGLVVTACDGGGTMVFTVYDSSNNVSGTYTLNAPFATQPTSDDFLLWGSDPAGISKVDLTYNNAFTHMFVDHFQYDMLNTVPVPEPASLVLAATGGGLAFLLLRRRKQARR